METPEELKGSPELSRGTRLANTPVGSGHDVATQGIIVQFDLCAPAYFWPQLQRYSFVNFVSSQSKMHMLTKMNLKEQCNDKTWVRTIETAELAVQMFNKGEIEIDEMLSNVPQGLQLTARLSTNYRQLKTQYQQRRTHRLPEWQQYCDWIQTLPYAQELITGGK
jgi:hypothetical protein